MVFIATGKLGAAMYRPVMKLYINFINFIVAQGRMEQPTGPDQMPAKVPGRLAQVWDESIHLPPPIPSSSCHLGTHN